MSPSLPQELGAALLWQAQAKPVPASLVLCHRFVSSSPFTRGAQSSCQEGLSAEEQYLLPETPKQALEGTVPPSLDQIPAEPGEQLLSLRKGSEHTGGSGREEGKKRSNLFFPPDFFQHPNLLRLPQQAPPSRVISCALRLWIAAFTFACTGEIVFLLLH